MGMIIDKFATTHPIKEARLAIDKTESSDDNSTKTVTYTTMKPEMAELKGTVYLGDTAITRFSVNKERVFSFKALDASAPQPLKLKSRLDLKRGKVTLQWKNPPAGHHLVVDYNYKDYSDGWSTLFITLGLIYLVSSLSWLFINCEKKIDEDEEETASED